MDKLAIMLKTYSGDFKCLKRLLDSYSCFNKDAIPLYVVLPEKEKEDFEKIFSGYKDIISAVIPEENFYDTTWQMSGWKIQQIVKLAFWQSGLCENYFCLDSDSYFIRDFYLSDFMFDEEIPYTILIEDKDLEADPLYYNTNWISRERYIKTICEKVGLENKKILTCHGFQIFSCKVLEDFYNNFVKINGYTYKEILDIAPYEFSWYNLWLQKRMLIPIHPCEPLFKTFHMRHQQTFAYLMGMTEQDFARSYIGIVTQSNWNTGKVKKYNEMGKYMRWLPTAYVGRIIIVSSVSCLHIIPEIFLCVKKNIKLLFEIIKRDGIIMTCRKAIKYVKRKVGLK